MPSLPETFACYLVRKSGKDQIEASIERRPFAELPQGEVLVRVEFSSLNYKDALAATGHPGVVRKFPHIPGIDAAGTVAASSTAQVKVGEKVIVTSYELGSGRFGAWAEYIRVPADWVVPLPQGLTTEEAMIYGTAGFTAAQCVLALQEHHITPDKGDIVVTGATGGVGLFAVQFLAHLGYAVTAVSGKPEKKDWLISLGAERVIDRGDVSDDSGQLLLSARWAGAVDTVGGNTLATLLRATDRAGCVAACGLVGGADLSLTVYPFILRGVTLAGIDSGYCPMPRRRDIWQHLAGDWKLSNLKQLSAKVSLQDLDPQIQVMLQGQHAGRTVVVLVSPM
jgi:acrylyl-CoA reductase (NADPH)